MHRTNGIYYDYTLKHKEWYILWIPSTDYDRALNYLKTSSIPMDIWVPSKEKLIRTGFECFYKLEPVFPGYIFIHTDSIENINSIEAYIKSNKDMHQYRILRNSKGVPTAYVPSFLVDTYEAPSKEFKRGDSVLIMTGPLSYLYGTVQNVTDSLINVSVYLKNIFYNLHINKKFSDIFLTHVELD